MDELTNYKVLKLLKFYHVLQLTCWHLLACNIAECIKGKYHGFRDKNKTDDDDNVKIK